MKKGIKGIASTFMFRGRERREEREFSPFSLFSRFSRFSLLIDMSPSYRRLFLRAGNVRHVIYL